MRDTRLSGCRPNVRLLSMVARLLNISIRRLNVVVISMVVLLCLNTLRALFVRSRGRLIECIRGIVLILNFRPVWFLRMTILRMIGMIGTMVNISGTVLFTVMLFRLTFRRILSLMTLNVIVLRIIRL